MRIKISRVAKDIDGIPRAFTIKINGKKYPRNVKGFYFPNDRKKITAINQAIEDYKIEENEDE